MHFSCESCRATLHIADEKVKGKRLVVRCKRCGNKINIADPALAASSPSLSHAAQKAAPAELKPVDPGDGKPGDSDTESTRAMESAVLEEALRASKADDAALSMEGVAPVGRPQPAPTPRDPPIWFAMIGGKQVGPVSRAEVALKTAQGAIGPRTYMWREGLGPWQRARDVSELASLFAPPPGKAAPPPPAPIGPPPVPADATGAQPALSKVRGVSPEKPERGYGDFSTGDFGSLAQGDGAEAPGGMTMHDPLPASPKAPVKGKPARAKPAPKPLDVSAESLKPIALGTDDEDEPTNAEVLPLGERIHQEDMARELFTTGHEAGITGAQDLAGWAADQLAAKRPVPAAALSKPASAAAPSRSPPGAAPSKPAPAAAVPKPAAPPPVAAPAAAPAPEPPRAAKAAPDALAKVPKGPDFAFPARDETTGEVLARSGVGGKRRAVFFALAAAAVVAIAGWLLWSFAGRDQSAGRVVTEVEKRPGKKSLGGTGDKAVGGLLKGDEAGERAAPEGAAAKAGEAKKPAEKPAEDEEEKEGKLSEDQEAALKSIKNERVGSHGPKDEEGEPPVARPAEGLRAEDFQRTVSESKMAYKKCIDEALRRNPKLRVGRINIAAKIAPSGKVIEASIDKKDVQESPLGQCLVRTSQRLVFPPFAGEPTDGVIPLFVAGGE